MVGGFINDEESCHECRSAYEVARHARCGTSADSILGNFSCIALIPALLGSMLPLKTYIHVGRFHCPKGPTVGFSGTDMQCGATAQTIVCKGRFICAANKKT